MKRVKKMKLTELQKGKLQIYEMKQLRGGSMKCACGGICIGSISTDFGDGYGTGVGSA